MGVESVFALNNNMANQLVTQFSAASGVSVFTVVLILMVIIVWELVWKLLAMWKAAKRNSPIWFVILAIFNTVGILPILYIYLFSKIGKKSASRQSRRRRR